MFSKSPAILFQTLWISSLIMAIGRVATVDGIYSYTEEEPIKIFTGVSGSNDFLTLSLAPQVSRKYQRLKSYFNFI